MPDLHERYVWCARRPARFVWTTEGSRHSPGRGSRTLWKRAKHEKVARCSNFPRSVLSYFQNSKLPKKLPALAAHPEALLPVENSILLKWCPQNYGSKLLRFASCCQFYRPEITMFHSRYFSVEYKKYFRKSFGNKKNKTVYNTK